MGEGIFLTAGQDCMKLRELIERLQQIEDRLGPATIKTGMPKYLPAEHPERSKSEVG